MIRLLNSIGKANFTEHFELYQRYNRTEMIAFLVDNGISNRNGAVRRVGCMQRLIDLGLEREALENVISPRRVSVETRERARTILNSLN